MESLVNEFCDRIDAVEPIVHAFVPEPDRRERIRADLGSARGSWRGVLVGVKDIIRVDGFPTRAGSTVPPADLAGRQASAVTRLLTAGAVVAGKTVTAEFAVAAPGPTTNPYDPAHTPGGSSSGSAAAVAAGMVPLALGTQTIGSIVRPAAYCGVVGFRGSHGRVAIDGILPYSPTLDTLGWFTADVASATLAARLLYTDWRADAVAASRPVLGVPSERFLTEASEPARAAFARHLRILADAGYEIRRTDVFSDFEEIAGGFFTINRWELANAHRGWFDRYEPRYRPATADAIRQGRGLDPAEYPEVMSWRTEFVRRIASVTNDDGIDVWVAPAATGTAPAGLESTGNPVMCVPFSLLGGPAVSVPGGFDERGLPWGLQCVGLPGYDEELLWAAAGIEAAISRPVRPR